MRSVFLLVLVVGVGLAGFAVYLAKGVFGDYQNALAAERAARANIVETVPVFVVKEGVRYGSQITEDNIRAVKWPKSAIPEGAFQSIEDLFPEGSKPFRTVLRTMEKDEAILAVKVTEPGADAGVASRLTAGMRAFAIKVDVTSGVSGFLAPGDRVDVYWTGQGISNSKSGNDGDVTRLIQSGIQIIAIDQTADIDRTSPTVARTVTVEATPAQVAVLAQARATGRLTLSLVGFGDDSVAETVEVDQNSLLGVTAEVVEEAPQAEVCTVRTRKGAEIVETVIPCPIN